MNLSVFTKYFNYYKSLGTTTLQEEINRESYQALCSYFDQYSDYHAKLENSEVKIPISEMREELARIGVIINSSKREKNIEILARTADFCR